MPTAPLVIIQARMASRRYPGKTLVKFSGRESLGHLIDALLSILPKEEIVVATSRDASDDPIAHFCHREQLAVFRGSGENVALRFFEILSARMPESFARLSADSPLFDPRVLQDTVALFEQTKADLATTSLAHPFPSGINVEVIRTPIFLNAYPSFSLPEHFEHVTRYFYDNPESIRIVALPCPIEGARQWKLSFDDPEDRERIEWIFSQMDQPHYRYSLAEKVRILSRKPGSLGSAS